MQRAHSKRRITAAVALVVTVAAGLATHALLPESAATDIAGDALYAVAAYLFVVLLVPKLKPWIVGAIAAAWCVAIELFQLTGIPIKLGEVFSPSLLVLGSVFDERDLVIYIVGAAALTIIDTIVSRVAAAQTPPAR